MKFGEGAARSWDVRDRIFQLVMTMVQRNKISLRSGVVREVVAIRYSWVNNPKSNLVNREGLAIESVS